MLYVGGSVLTISRLIAIHMWSNRYINTGVRYLEVALLNRPMYAEINIHILDRILHST